MFKNKYLLVAVLLLIAGFQTLRLQRDAEQPARSNDTAVEARESESRPDEIARAFAERRSNVQVAGTGVVDKLLSDDNNGSRHQRFIVRLANGQTLLIAHNIDLAPRIDTLRIGDAVQFFGEYEWNDKGGVLHWTHHDPQGRHPGGWLEHEGRRYE